MITIIAIVIMVALLVLALLMRKRFGILGLSLAAGTLLANQLTPWLTDVMQVFQQFLGGVSPIAAAAILLTILPSIILMLTKHKKYHTMKGRIVGAILYTLMAGFATIPFIIGSIDVADEVKNFIVNSQAIAMTIGVILALTDLILPHKNPDKK